MATALSSSYAQKSGIFLYPLLGLRKHIEFRPTSSFVYWPEQRIKPRDARLLIYYKIDEEQIIKYNLFERNYLLANRYIEACYHVENGFLYKFNLERFKEDFVRFERGRYSKFSTLLKEIVSKFHEEKLGDARSQNLVIESYLYPEKYFEKVAKELEVSLELVKESGELCSLMTRKERLALIK